MNVKGPGGAWLPGEWDRELGDPDWLTEDVDGFDRSEEREEPAHSALAPWAKYDLNLMYLRRALAYRHPRRREDWD